jgi:hypothetical protein
VRVVNVLLALLISAVMAIAVFELGLRLIPTYRAQPTLNRFDPATGWSKTPGRTVTRRVAGRPIEFAINAEGLRDDALVPKPAGTFRVLVLGDSFALGYTVERRKAFADLLEARWKAEGRSIEVVNAGTEGWSTDQEAVWLLERGRDYAPDLVLLVPYENDVYWCGQTSYTRFPKPRFAPDGTLEPRTLVDPGPGPALERSAIVRFLALTVAKLLVRHPTPLEFEVPGTQSVIARESAPLLLEPPEFLADCVARTEGALIALARGCRELGAPLVVAPIPSKSAVDSEEREFFREDALDGLDDSRWSPERPVELFLELARKHGLAAIDARAELRADAADEKLYFERDVEWHFNPAGNRAFAEVLHDRLDDARLVPPAERAVSAAAVPTTAPPVRRPRWPYVFAGLWIVLSALYMATYADERDWKAPLKVGAMLATVFAIVLGGGRLLALVPAKYSLWVAGGFLALVLGFVLYKLGRRIGTILELLRTFVERGHWYLMPLLVVLLSIGSLLVVAASSPLIAPFIYTLF